ncbi:hypothetical protein [Hydrocoleum sp. CS-953]|uniref:hypothetical protein n=1 Tax=Dapis sp. BLCC M172 TaxID=2975281 RepID=UPI000B9AE449|nr:hypothetical protein AFK68_11220 [Hydrocoleum sp. CS-953]
MKKTVGVWSPNPIFTIFTWGLLKTAECGKCGEVWEIESCLIKVLTFYSSKDRKAGSFFVLKRLKALFINALRVNQQP